MAEKPNLEQQFERGLFASRDATGRVSVAVKL